jgi:tetratricopeptide (TPR) repeat protein
MNSSRLSAFCDRALEAGWLLAVAITPVFFNVYSSRVFEPDKLTTLRALAIVMAILWLTRFADEKLHSGRSPGNGNGLDVRFDLETPMVLPAVLTMVVYLISTAFSLVPYTSLIGSYQRLQGTHTLFAYLVIFFALLTGMRTRRQLSRLITMLILSSLPVALYGIIQHNGLDPLPWAGDVTRRVASNMGNAIFVAAYLVMIVPLTASRIIQSFGDILRREEPRVTDVLRASGYIFIIAVQLLTIFYARSRGPWLGIIAAGFLFPFVALILLQRQARTQDPEYAGSVMDVVRGLGFGVGSLVLTGAIAALAWWALEGPIAIYASVGLAVLTFGGIWLHFIVEQRGWEWLWIGWGTVGLVIALGLVLINVPGPLQDRVRTVNSLRRFTTITQLQKGTGKVRGLIWQGAVDLISFHEPIEYPDGSVDRFNVLRPLIGYGPESMYVAYNSFYPPELGHYESRTASPDRSHNETLDSLVITGVLGLGVYLFTFGSFFIWGFRWLGLLKTRKQVFTYVGMDLFFALLFFVIAWQLEGAYLFAVAIPLGILVGTMVYLTFQALRSLFGPMPEEAVADSLRGHHPHVVLLIGLLAGTMAHFIEINFGIAIASTRTVFWVYAALLVILGMKWVPAPPLAAVEAEENGNARRTVRRRYRSSTSLKPWLAGVVALSLASTFLLGTLVFDFVNNPQRLSNAGKIFWHSLTMKYHPEPSNAYGALMIFLFTWALFGVVGLGEFDREGLFDIQRRSRWLTAIGTYAGVTLVGLLIFGFLIAGHQASLTTQQVATIDDVVNVADRLANMLGYYYALIFVIVVMMTVVLVRESPQARDSGHLFSYAGLVVLILLSIGIIRTGSYDLIRADIVFKQGGVFANSRKAQDKQIGIQHFERSIEYAPREDYYFLFLGKAYLELAQGLGEDTTFEQREQIFLRTEEVLKEAREINPLNTDHSANLARFYKSWAARTSSLLNDESLSETRRSDLQAQRATLLDLSLENYRKALTLSPNNPILWNELAQLYAVDIGDQEKFQETIDQSLEVDDEFEQTWMLLGDLRSSRGDIDGAIEAYRKSLEVQESCDVRRVVGTLLTQQSSFEEAQTFLTSSLDMCQDYRQRWEMYRVLAYASANLGRTQEAMEAAMLALQLAPENQKPVVQQLIDQLQGTSEQPTAPLTQP